MSIWLVNEFATQLVQSVVPGHEPRYTDAKELNCILQGGPMEQVLDLLCGEIDFSLQGIWGNNVNWWTHDKLSTALRRAGFQTVMVTPAGGSIAAAMRDRQYFDLVNPTFSLFADAVR